MTEILNVLFSFIGIILIPAYTAVYWKCEKSIRMLRETREYFIKEISDLRTEMLKDFATKQELINSTETLTLAIQNLEKHIQSLTNTIISINKKGRK